MIARGALLVAALLVPPGCAGWGGPAPPPVSDGQYRMGTVLEITLHGLAPVAAAAALDEAFAVAGRLDALLSIHEPDSDIYRANRAAGHGPGDVDPDVAEILERSLAYTRLTRGSFDVTVGPLVALWTRAAGTGVPPSPADLARARSRVGPVWVRVSAGPRVELLREGVSLDLGGIAKGFALDRIVPALRARGVTSALLSFGQSSTYALGAPPDADGWRLLLRGPGAAFVGVITLVDQALSVSSSLSQSVEIGGRRYGHVVDPRSGWPLTERRQAVVVAPEATLAEALTKALLILSEADGLALVAAQPGCEGLLVDARGRLARSPGWDAAVRFEPATADPVAASSDRSVAPMHAAWRRENPPARSVTRTSLSPETRRRASRSSAVIVGRPAA